jgi:2,4-dienoyl-CoA reductase (NADPH2)
MANDAVESGAADAVEMTRAQIADPDLVAKSRRGETPRPCLRCNEACQVRDVRNPIVSCVVEPSAGHERDDPDWYDRAQHSRAVVVAGAGIAGLETARTAAIRGHRVRILERLDEPGGVAARVGPGRPLVEWLLGELDRLGVPIETGVSSIDTAAGEVLVAATGSRPGERSYSIAPDALVLDVLDAVPPEGPIAVWDPIGGPIAVALAERLGRRAVLVTPDQLAGNELSRTGDLAPANVRLQQAGVRIERRAILRAVHAGSVEIEDRFSGVTRTLEAVALVDCGFRLPDESVDAAIRAGDCVAPRTILEAVLEGRRAALAVDGAP